MPRRLALIIVVFLFSISPIIFSVSINAAWEQIGDPLEENYTDLNKAFEQYGSDKLLQDFCAKRQGGQMNLETWYSGKCPKAGDTSFTSMSGEGVGFSDIVILDLMEKISGEKDPNETIWQKIDKAVKALQSAKNLSQQDNNSDSTLSYSNVDSARNILFSGQNSGLIGQSGKLITMLFENQPATTKSYLAYISKNLQQHKIISPALAANGVGFETFSPFLTIWIAFRNLAYLGLVVFFIVYGFMLMFRVNLGQKTAISIQLAIPKLIVTLLIITFSFAIVGLIYDLMWVIITFIFTYFKSQGIIQGTLLPNIASGKYGMIVSAILNSLIAGPTTIFGILNVIFGGVLATIGTVLGVTGYGWVISFMVIIAVLISYAKLFFKLFTAFISVIISLITAPIVLLGNALPGSNAIGTWLRGIVANLSVFPITMLFLFFSYLLMIQPLLSMCNSLVGIISVITGGNACEPIFGVKQLTTTTAAITQVPLISSPLGMTASGLLALLGVGLLLMASKYVDMVRDALKVPAFKYGTAIGEALKGDWTGAGNLNPDIARNSLYQKLSPFVGAKAGTPLFPGKPKGNIDATGKSEEDWNNASG